MPSIPVSVPRRFVMVSSIVVRSDCQNQDIGRRLMDKMDEWAATKGTPSIELNVYEFNSKAMAFYQSLGYEILSRRMEKH